MKNIWIITLFPNYFGPLFETGVVGAAFRGERATVPKIHFLNPSDFNPKGFKGVDGSPYGGGAGQVMRADVLEACLLSAVFKEKKEAEIYKKAFNVIYLGPRGVVFDQGIAKNMAREIQTEDSKEYVFICGRYEGIDERFISKYVDDHLCLGDFVLSGGEVALLPILDSIFRLVPGVLGNSDSPLEESFNGKGIEYPQYTKPQETCGEKVPEVLLGGNHGEIAKWRESKRKEFTKTFRPDLLKEES